MLEAIRNRAQGWIAKLILGFIALTFAVWGINWYFEGGAQALPAVSIDGEVISQQEFLDTLRQQQEQLGQQAADDPALRQRVLDQLVNTRLLTRVATRAGLQVTDAQVSAFLLELTPFQDNGKFSQQKLDAWLRSRGMTPAHFDRMVRQALLLQQIQAAYAEGAVMPRTVASRLGRLLAEAREVQERVFDLNQYLADIEIDARAIEAEYNAHRQEYMTPAQVRVQYLVLSPDILAKQIDIDPAAARQYYEANPSRYQEPEQRRASHILIRADAAMDAQGRQAARAKAQQLLQEVQRNPALFEKLARAHSQDPLSAERGGDLGSFSRDMMVKPFADAVFTMQPGEIRGLVETEFGYHIIRLDAIIPGKKLGFEVVKSEIIEALRQQEAQRRFAEAAERFSNLVYEQPESLEQVAQALNLPLKESGWISRQAADPAMLANPRLLDALFSEEALVRKHNTEAIEVAPNVLVSARVLAHRPEGLRPLPEVAGEIRLKLATKAARAKAIAAGQQALKAAQASEAVPGMGAAMTLTRMRPLSLPPEAVRAIYRARTDRLPAYVGVETREGYRLYRINRVTQGQVPEDQLRLIRRDLQRLVAQDELRALLADLRAQAKIEVNQAFIERKAE